MLADRAGTVYGSAPGIPGKEVFMPIVTQCAAPGCETLTMGPYCIEHERTPAHPDAGEPPSPGQKSVGARGGGSIPPVAGTPASSSSSRRITALLGAKSSRLLLNIA
jgi:hypothetical protein